MALLSTELDTLVDRLVELGRPVVAWLVPGVDPSRVESLLGVVPPAEVVTWFGWCNGVALRAGQRQDDVSVIPGYSPLSLQEAVDAMAAYAGDVVLGENWIPILGGSGGDIYAATWRLGEGASIAGVLVGEPTEIEFASLDEMMRVFNECYRDGAFYVDENGRLAMDAARYDEIYERMTE